MQYPVDGAWVHPSFRTDGTGTAPTVEIWHALRQNNDFMTLFADRAYKSLFNDGALTDANSLARWDTLNDYIYDAVTDESARWGDSLAGLGQPTRTRDVDWQNEVDKIASIMVGNAAQLVAAMRAQGFYPSIDPATFSLRGGTVPAGYHVQLSSPVGTVYYTLDGSDPRLPGGGVSPSAIAYGGGGVAINSDTTIRLRVFSAGQWSALDEATFQAVQTGNAPPVVAAGNDLTVPLGGQANLAGMVTDDNLPSGTLTSAWSVVTGPGAVTFADASHASTTATFSTTGVYVLRLTGSDGQFSVSDDVSVTVSNPATPTILALALINADTDLPIPGYESLQPGVVLNLATLSTTHLNVSAIGSNSVSSVKFGLDGNANFRTERSAPFSLFGDTNGNFAAGSFAVGAHTITATPNPGASSGAALSVAFTVINQAAPTNEAPRVSAGGDLSVTLPNMANLSGTASDDGLPSGSLTTTWSKFSGPGDVTFGDASQLATTASFSAAGTYVLRLTASDGELSSFDDVSATVASPSGLEVLSLTLINADNEQPIAGYESIQPGAVINLATLATTHLNVRANVSSSVKSVKFGFDANANFRTEGTAPFALFGDANGNYTAGSFALGSHTIAATPYAAASATGTPGPTLSVSFTVINQPVVTNQAPIVSAGAGQDVVLPNSANLAGSVTDDGLPGGPLTIAWTKISGPGSVAFGNAAQPSTTATFSAAGSYVLELSANDGEFTSTSNVTINVTTVPVGPAVTSLTLIDADADQPIPGYENLVNGAVIDLATLPTSNLNIRANTTGSFGSVKFEMDGNANFRNESSAPYALFGDTQGNYNGVHIAVGAHTVTATTYSNKNGTGTAGGGVSVSFTVVGAAQQLIASGEPASAVQALPAEQSSTSFTVSWSGNDDVEGAGLVGFDIYVSVDDQPYSTWLEGTSATSAIYDGSEGRTYRFYSAAISNAGLVEAAPLTADATTTLLITRPFAKGDYNHDGQLDGADFLHWQRMFGSPAEAIGSGAGQEMNVVVGNLDDVAWQNHFGNDAALEADYTQDGAVDGADFLKWQRALGSHDLTVDRDNNGVSDAADLDAWLNRFAEAPSAAAIMSEGLMPVESTGLKVVTSNALIEEQPLRVSKRSLESMYLCPAATKLKEVLGSSNQRIGDRKLSDVRALVRGTDGQQTLRKWRRDTIAVDHVMATDRLFTTWTHWRDIQELF
jgi:hypothetical protein